MHPVEFAPVDGGTQNFQNYEGKLSFQHKSVIGSYNKMFSVFFLFFFFSGHKKTWFFCSFILEQSSFLAKGTFQEIVSLEKETFGNIHFCGGQPSKTFAAGQFSRC